MKLPGLAVHSLAASLVATALAVSGCGTDGTAGTAGSVDINIDLEGADDQSVDVVTWRIVGPGFDESGPINTSQPGTSDDDVHRQTGFFEKSGLLPCDPPGSNCYTVYLTATSTDGDTMCEGSAPFTIYADERTDVYVRINCTTVERLGAVRVNGEFNRCGVIDQVVVSPLQVAVSYIIDGEVWYSDAEGDPMTVRWTGVGGTVNPVDTDVTEYTCESITPPECTGMPSDPPDCVDQDNPATWTNSITVEVSDDNFTYCVDSWTVRVTCVEAPSCGDGVFDPAVEECDPSAPGGVPPGWVCDPATCQRIPSCGDSILDPGEECDPPDGVFCDAMCQDIDPCAVPGVCNDFDDCTQDACSANPVDNSPVCDYTPEPDGTACFDFAPNSGVCIAGTCVAVPPPISQAVGIVASNNVTGDISELPYELTVTALGPVVDGVPVDFAVTGIAFFPPVFLNAAIATIPGLTEVTLNALSATPMVRSGVVGTSPGSVPATNLDLTTLTSANPLPSTETIPILGLPGSIPICGPLNLATCPNTCTDGTACSQPGPDVCAGIGDGTCAPRGACICVVEPLALPLSSDIVTVTPDITQGGDILFGWNEDLLPPQTVIVTNPPGPNGIRVLAVVLQVGIEGWMGKLISTNPDVAGPLLDSEMLAIPISP